MQLSISPDFGTPPRHRLVGDVAREVAYMIGRYQTPDRLFAPSQPRVRLIFADQMLEDSHTLSYYNIQDQSTLQIVLMAPPIQFYVEHCGGHALVVYADRGDTIGVIKGYVRDKIGIPPNQQFLIYGREQLEDDKTLCDYDIHNGSTLHLASMV